MDNLFGIFDPVSSFSLSLNWIAVLLFVLVPTSFWVSYNRVSFLLKSITIKLHQEIKISLGIIATPGITWFTISLFIIIAIINYIGLIPYVFTPSSHLSFTLRLSMLIWTALIIGSLCISLYEFLAHLVPFGTPLGLIILIVLIEIVSVLIRPITLSVRLAANIVAGHLLISLVCIPSLSNYPVFAACLIGARVMIILERAVALIQAYVFSTLSSLYIRDLNASIKL